MDSLMMVAWFRSMSMTSPENTAWDSERPSDGVSFMQEQARALALRLFDRDTGALRRDAKVHLERAALLVLGSPSQIDTFLQSTGLPPRPAEIANLGEARAWTARSAQGKAVFFVEATTAENLQPMLRSLPHYRSKSYVVFKNGRAAGHGVWAISAGPLAKPL